jgi:hypothetical protein
MSLACGVNGPVTIWFPPANYWFNSTVYLEHSAMVLEGSSGGASQGTLPPQTNIAGPTNGPAFYINDTDSGLVMRDLAISGTYVGVVIQNAAGIRFTNVHIDADVYSNATTGPGCNVDLVSNTRNCCSSSSPVTLLIILRHTGILECPVGNREFLLGLAREVFFCHGLAFRLRWQGPASVCHHARHLRRSWTLNQSAFRLSGGL